MFLFFSLIGSGNFTRYRLELYINVFFFSEPLYALNFSTEFVKYIIIHDAAQDAPFSSHLPARQRFGDILLCSVTRVFGMHAACSLRFHFFSQDNNARRKNEAEAMPFLSVPQMGHILSMPGSRTRTQRLLRQPSGIGPSMCGRKRAAKDSGPRFSLFPAFFPLRSSFFSLHMTGSLKKNIHGA